jgi:hypothetical protein
MTSVGIYELPVYIIFKAGWNMLKLLPVKRGPSTDTETSRQNYWNAVQIFTLINSV